jgi:hypothetical protein
MNDLKARLVGLAAIEGLITYGELARGLDMRFGALIATLEQLMEQDHCAGRPLLAVVCISRLHAYMPAEGFFIKALELGLDIPDRPAFVIAERAALRAFYSGVTPGA